MLPSNSNEPDFYCGQAAYERLSANETWSKGFTLVVSPIMEPNTIFTTKPALVAILRALEESGQLQK